ncbi:ribonuclease HII [Paenibacillus sp. UMB4589-SE434]|uniref:ribonuclease HII n=1 Tax=Paenibacillus sp. UMB4589-SE434 TaxID=3046314 RepID=UPI002550E814|nr:ribonuclease HII [Paenibacillus sp. UMB4589-SE434]MDK8180752.1 ribonuclease HII [Paenibacillus sp. UMB4589-SE434]
MARVKQESADVDLLLWEKRYWDQGYEWIAGIDEVGRGCLFGDVIAAAVILPKGVIIEGINDSKKLTEKKREFLYDQIIGQAAAWAVARMDAAKIDEVNIKQATRLAMKEAVTQLQIRPDVLLIDAERIECNLPQESIIKGDATSQSIAAASIVAKVTRDRLCAGEWDQLYPAYGIGVHKGYGTKLHREKLLELGPTPMHRKSFLTKIWDEQLTLF